MKIPRPTSSNLNREVNIKLSINKYHIDLLRMAAGQLNLSLQEFILITAANEARDVIYKTRLARKEIKGDK